MGEKKEEHFTTLNEWIEAHSYGKNTISISDAQSPEPEYRARVADEDDINTLLVSFQKFQTVHENSIFVCFWPESESFPDKSSFPFRVGTPMYKACAKNGFFCIAGDHTQIALSRLRHTYPNNPNWQTLTGQFLICRRNASDIDRCKSWGIVDNIKGQRRTTMSFESKILALHQDQQTLIDRLGVDNDDLKSAITQVKAARRRDYNLTANSFGQLWNIASRTGEVWGAVEKIVTGKVANASKFKKPKSASCFTTMGGIPDADLAVLLRSVVSGEHTLQNFSVQCKVYKARARVQSTILQFGDVNMTSWAVAKANFPNTCSAKLVDMWAQHIVKSSLKVSAPLPQTFYAMLEQRLAADKSINQSRDHNQTVNHH